MNRQMLLIAVCLAWFLPHSGQAQSYDLDYFVKKWSKQQKDVTESVVVSWISGESQAVVSNHVVDLVRVEALLASAQVPGVSLYLPAIGEVTPAEVPGQLLRFMLVERNLRFGSDSFFANRQFRVLPIENQGADLAGVDPRVEPDATVAGEVADDNE